MTVSVIAGWTSILLVCLTGISVALLHLLDQFDPAAERLFITELARQLFYDDEYFTHAMELREYPTQRVVHMVLGIGYLVLAPLQFVPAIRRRFPALHRTIGWSSITMSLVLCVGGLVIAINASYAGFGEQVAMTVFNILYIPTILMAILNIRAGRVHRHREWMICGFAMMLAIIAVRIWFMLFKQTDYPSRDFFVFIMWLSVGVNMTIATSWIMFTRRRSSA